MESSDETTDKNKQSNTLFPYKDIRPVQSDMMNDIQNCIKTKSHAILHAPTGLGKTVASLAPALRSALDNKLTVFFLTSRHTQHLIAIETLKLIKEKFAENIVSVDIIGKKHMCLQPGVDMLYSNEFLDYCKSMKTKHLCEYYETMMNHKITGETTLSETAKKLLDELKKMLPLHVEKLTEECRTNNVCPYEMSIKLAKKANIIICDYNYIFNPSIAKNFFGKTGKELEKSTVIVDEGHNLPSRVREALSQKLSTIQLRRAIKEAGKYKYDETIELLDAISAILVDYGRPLEVGEEKLVTKADFVNKIEKTTEMQQLIADLEFIATDIREKQKRSYIGSVAGFLLSWLGEDDGFARMISRLNTRYGESIMISYRCLDPSIATADVIKNTHSTIMMSGTLTPTAMYRDLLGFPKNTFEKAYKSPFPKENKLSIIVPKTTTKFTMRNAEMYDKIAKISADIVNLIPGNVIVFFPSYYMRDEINRFFTNYCKKTTFVESPDLRKTEKQDLLDEFKKYEDVGAVLLGVVGANFAEGIDLPGDLLKAVIIIGLPLQKPDLETQQLIDYFDKKFSKGWDYGYLLPAMNKCFQSTGRCIRSETDRGVVIYLDQRYAWQTYLRCFQENVIITEDYEKKIKEFFDKHQ